MGTTAQLVIVGGPPALVDAALVRLHRLEAAWSRVRADSELSQLNAAEGAAVVVSADTAVLVHALVSAWEFTGVRRSVSSTARHAIRARGCWSSTITTA